MKIEYQREMESFSEAEKDLIIEFFNFCKPFWDEQGEDFFNFGYRLPDEMNLEVFQAIFQTHRSFDCEIHDHDISYVSVNVRPFRSYSMKEHVVFVGWNAAFFPYLLKHGRACLDNPDLIALDICARPRPILKRKSPRSLPSEKRRKNPNPPSTDASG